MIVSVVDVTSVEQPGLELYRTLRRSIEHRRTGLFVVEGNKVVLRFLASNLDAVSILLTEAWLQKCRYDLERRVEPVTVYRISEKLVKSIVGFNYHQGIMAVGRVPRSLPLETLCTGSAGARFLVALDYLSNSENTGVIIRNCAACGVHAVISGDTSTDPYLRRSVRNSMGNVFRMGVHYSDNLAATLHRLRTEFGFSIIAAHLSSAGVSMHDIDFTGNCCIVMGNEQHGVSPAVLEQCDRVAVIPMAPGVDSFNVGCASAILLYEAFLQRSGSTR